MTPTPLLPIRSDGRCAWDNAVLVLMNAAVLSLMDGAGAIPARASTCTCKKPRDFQCLLLPTHPFRKEVY